MGGTTENRSAGFFEPPRFTEHVVCCCSSGSSSIYGNIQRIVLSKRTKARCTKLEYIISRKSEGRDCRRCLDGKKNEIEGNLGSLQIMEGERQRKNDVPCIVRN